MYMFYKTDPTILSKQKKVITFGQGGWAFPLIKGYRNFVNARSLLYYFLPGDLLFTGRFLTFPMLFTTRYSVNETNLRTV